MARNVNKVFLLGNATETPDLKHTRSGTAVVNFGLATNESYKDASGEYQEKAQFHNVTAWGKGAELISELVRKGQQLHIEGSINYGSYENNEGQTVRTTEIKMRDFTLCGGRPTVTGDNEPDSDSDEGDEDDLPF